MDIVITYVNGADPEWQRSYAEYTHKPLITKRYRDWGTLKYLLRAIQKNLPFIGNVFLVVSSRSQVPEWASQELKVVTHDQIIPAEHLPTFNSTCIEMFLHRIPGLDEEYIYFNDDIFPVLPCEESDFFRDGKAVLKFHRCLLRGGQFRKHTLNSDRLARKALELNKVISYLRPKHSATTMLRSVCEEAFGKEENEILSRISRVREDKNINQYYFLDYQKLSGKTIDGALSKKHFSLAVSSESDIRAFFENPSSKLVGINDTKVSPEKENAIGAMLDDVMNRMFPDKSRFEK